MPDTVLDISGLDSFYGDFQALYGVSMRIEKGEVIAVIGANGAGKTTLMRSVTGLLSNKPDMARRLRAFVDLAKSSDRAQRRLLMATKSGFGA